MSWRCATCDKLFETISEDAVLITKGAFSTVTVYRFADGEVHCLRRFMPMRLETKHKAFHKTKKVVGCEFCFPPPEPEPPQSPMPVELPPHEEVIAQVEEVIGQEIEDDHELTSMELAFKHIRK